MHLKVMSRSLGNFFRVSANGVFSSLRWPKWRSLADSVQCPVPSKPQAVLMGMNLATTSTAKGILLAQSQEMKCSEVVEGSKPQKSLRKSCAESSCVSLIARGGCKMQPCFNNKAEHAESCKFRPVPCKYRARGCCLVCEAKLAKWKGLSQEDSLTLKGKKTI